MKVRMSIRNKMLINILTSTVIIFTLSIGYMSYKTRVLVLDDAKKLALSVTKENALKIEKSLSEDLALLQTLSKVFTFNQGMEEEEWKNFFADISKAVIEDKGNFYGFSGTWAERFYNNEAEARDKRYYYYLERTEAGFTEKRSIRDINSNFYQRAKALNEDALMEPNIWRRDEELIVKAHILCPLRIQNQFGGYVVGDFSTKAFQEIVSAITPYKETKGYLVSNSGVFVAHPNNLQIGDTLSKVSPHLDRQFNLSENIKQGHASVFKGHNEDGKKIVLVTAPIQVGKHKAPWALTLEIPVKSILTEANKNQTTSLIVALFGVLLIAGIIYWRASNIGSDIRDTTLVLEKLSLGDIENINSIEMNRGDELDVMAHSVNSLKNSLNTTSEFAEQIGVGHLDAEFTPLSKNDKLGNSLLSMQQNLKVAKADEERMKLEEERNKWTSDGLAQFGDIIRSNNDDAEKLSYSIVKNLVDYLGLSIGALFVAESTDDDALYEVKAAVAYERQKLINAKYKIGESLVGRCVYEKKPIYIKDVPQDYMNITSGLGTVNPTCLLLVPLISEERVLGVVELAAMHDIEDYKVAFVEKLAENIASTLASVQINEQTVTLLEQSKLQSEELAAQEEEMRQNMEELQATQEEAARREQEMLSVLDVMNEAVFKVEYDVSGKILAVNNNYANFLNTNADALVNKTVKDESALLGQKVSEVETIWNDLVVGGNHSLKVNVTINAESHTINEYYSAIFQAGENKATKIIKVGYVVA